MSDSSESVVLTTSGKVEGIKEDGLFVFKGIPYAAPPVGERRWLPPEPVTAWKSVRWAKKFGPVGPQIINKNSILEFEKEISNQSEDCLYLNIWTPGLDNRRRPVMFWIHGGGFAIGAGSARYYTGKHLAMRGDAVVVSINYRLGLLGFLNLNEVTGGKIPSTGNEGLLDQVMALEWVRDNITAFGGDPDNVTIFGESAGAMCVGTLLALPSAHGLFHKAICQSGAASTVFTTDKAKRAAELFLDIVGLDANDVSALRTLTVDKLLQAQLILPRKTWESELKVTMSLIPVVDGEVLPRLPLTAIEEGVVKSIPMIVGTTLDEIKLFATNDPRLKTQDEALLVKKLGEFIPSKYVSGLIETYRKARAKRGASTSPNEILSAIQTDRLFWVPAVRLLAAQRKQNQNIFNYLFTWESTIQDGKLGACHCIDVAFVFGITMLEFTGAGVEADALVKKTQDSWLAFARTGNPSCESLGNWPKYGKQHETMILGKECSVVKDLYAEELRAWECVPDSVFGTL